MLTERDAPTVPLHCYVRADQQEEAARIGLPLRSLVTIGLRTLHDLPEHGKAARAPSGNRYNLQALVASEVDDQIDSMVRKTRTNKTTIVMAAIDAALADDWVKNWRR